MFNNFSDTERILLTAFELSDNSVKTIAEVTGINPSTLYKWKTTDVHLSAPKANALLLYFIENEPMILIKASLVDIITDKLQDYSTSLTE